MSIPVTLESGNLAQLDEGREILTYSRLPGLRKVAILLRSLVLEDAAAAQALLDSLNSMEQVMVKEELDSMGVLEPDMVTDVLKEFDVLCGIHTAFRDRGIDGAISVGEKYLHTTQARRLALALGHIPHHFPASLPTKRAPRLRLVGAEAGPEVGHRCSGERRR